MLAQSGERGREQTQKQTRVDTGVYVKSYAVSAAKNNNITVLSTVGGGWQVKKGKCRLCKFPLERVDYWHKILTDVKICHILCVILKEKMYFCILNIESVNLHILYIKK